MRKDKEIKIDSVPSLVKRITGLWDEQKEKALAQEAEQKELLKTEIRKEREITGKLKEARSIALKMEKEYSQIEVKVIAEKKKEASKDALREADVRSGKASLKEFMSKGKRDSEISDEVIKKSTAELEQGLKAIRKKNLEILELEKSLCECQNMIRNLSLRPAQILQKVLRDCRDITDQEIGLFLEDNYGLREAIEQAKLKIQLTKGVSITPGYRWDRLTQEEANKLIFNPIIPLDVVPQLKAELEKFKDAEKINVAYFWRSKSIDVTPDLSSPHRIQRIHKMSDLKEKPDARFKRKK